MNEEVVKFQILLIIILVFLSFVFFPSFRFMAKKVNKSDLQVNVNKATIEELMIVPYIGKVNGQKIIDIRRKNNGIKHLNQLKNLRYYKRFKYFLKVK